MTNFAKILGEKVPRVKNKLFEVLLPRDYLADMPQKSKSKKFIIKKEIKSHGERQENG